jgi:putative acetyltransferase
VTTQADAVVTVRPFAWADAPPVSALIATTMRRSNAGDYPAERLEALIAYFTPEKLRHLASERQCLVALVAGGIVGTAAREGETLSTFFVHPEHQGRGVGTRLLAPLEAAARAAGLTALRVDASLAGAGFYERRGYQRTGTMVEGTAGPHVALVKSFADAGD